MIDLPFESTAAMSGTDGLDLSIEECPRLGLIAGEGQLPVRAALNAKSQGYAVVTFALSSENQKALKRVCEGRVYPISPGLFNQTLALLNEHRITQLLFAGKVNKWLLFRNPRLDGRALRLLKNNARKNDDKLMHIIIDELQTEGITVVNQAGFLKDLFLPPKVLNEPVGLTAQDWEDIQYGFEIAKSIGGADIGQTVVVSNGMVLAVEAIEGTDECLKRAARWSRKKGGVVVKVAKPDQDLRFDIPTVGLRTLKVMKSCGLKVLATEAHQTLFLELEDMIAFANRHGMALVSVSGEERIAP